MASRLDGKITIVTGGGRGIGRGVALRFAAEGARVVVATRSETPGRETVEAIGSAGGEAVLDVVDLPTHAAVSALVARITERFGGIDVVIHNAASLETALVADVADDMLDRMFDLNVKCCFWLAKDALPWLRRSSAGRILITSSPAGNRVSLRRCVPYGAAKMAVLGFVRGAALELARDRITVNAVEPGFTLSHTVQTYLPPEQIVAVTATVPIGWAALPADIAATFVFLASDDASYITGQTFAVDGGLTLGSVFEDALFPQEGVRRPSTG